MKGNVWGKKRNFGSDFCEYLSSTSRKSSISVISRKDMGEAGCDSFLKFSDKNATRKLRNFKIYCRINIHVSAIHHKNFEA